MVGAVPGLHDGARTVSSDDILYGALALMCLIGAIVGTILEVAYH